MDTGNAGKKEGTNLLLPPFTAITRIGSSLSLVWVDLGPSHGVSPGRVLAVDFDCARVMRVYSNALHLGVADSMKN